MTQKKNWGFIGNSLGYIDCHTKFKNDCRRHGHILHSDIECWDGLMPTNLINEMPRDSVMGWKASKPIIVVFGLVGGREFGGFTVFRGGNSVAASWPNQIMNTAFPSQLA